MIHFNSTNKDMLFSAVRKVIISNSIRIIWDHIPRHTGIKIALDTYVPGIYVIISNFLSHFISIDTEYNTYYTNQIFNLPLKSPVAKKRVCKLAAPNVPHLKAELFST